MPRILPDLTRPPQADQEDPEQIRVLEQIHAQAEAMPGPKPRNRARGRRGTQKTGPLPFVPLPKRIHAGKSKFTTIRDGVPFRPSRWSQI